MRRHEKFHRNAITSLGTRTSGVTPYRLTRKPFGEWSIGYGLCNFLIAEGSAYSIREGMAMLEMLNKQYWRKP